MPQTPPVTKEVLCFCFALFSFFPLLALLSLSFYLNVSFYASFDRIFQQVFFLSLKKTEMHQIQSLRNRQDPIA
jgi:hypothetical protein